MNNEQRIQEMEAKLIKMQAEIADLSGQFYKNNLSSTQVFNKDCVFNSRMRAPVFSTAPTVAEIGDVFSSAAGILYVCTTASTAGAGAVWTVIGTQV